MCKRIFAVHWDINFRCACRSFSFPNIMGLIPEVGQRKRFSADPAVCCITLQWHCSTWRRPGWGWRRLGWGWSGWRWLFFYGRRRHVHISITGRGHWAHCAAANQRLKIPASIWYHPSDANVCDQQRGDRWLPASDASTWQTDDEGSSNTFEAWSYWFKIAPLWGGQQKGPPCCSEWVQHSAPATPLREQGSGVPFY